MTVGSDVKKTLASLKSAQASLETFAIGTQNQQAKQLYEQAAQATQSVVSMVEQQVVQLEQQEPQYKGF